MKKLSNKNNILKGAGVLLIAAVMILSTIAVTANTFEDQPTRTMYSKLGTDYVTLSRTNTEEIMPSPLENRDTIFTESFEDPWVADSNGDLAPPGWENHITDPGDTGDPYYLPWHWGQYGTVTSYTPPAVPVDGDFQAMVQWSYNHQDEWLVTPLIDLSGYTICELTFWRFGHLGSTQLDHYYVKVSPTGGYDQSDFTDTLWDASDLPAADNYYDYPYTVDLSAYDGTSIRVAWQNVDGDGGGLWYGSCIDAVEISGGGAEDTTPPVTTCECVGEMEDDIFISDVTVYLNATDDQSGVDYTMYKLDADDWTEYTAPFVVSEDGDHTVYFYSVDNAGNEEDEKSCTFTIQHPCYINITISGGIGVTATITNTGEEDLEGVEWTIALDGGLIIIGKTKSGTVDIPANESVDVKSFVLGIGKPTITATAGCGSAEATGTVILIFVLGVA